MALRLLGGGSSLNTIVSDMNANILTLQTLMAQIQGQPNYVVQSGYDSITVVAGSTVNLDILHDFGNELSGALVTFDTVQLPAMFDVAVATPLTCQTYMTYEVQTTKLRITIKASASTTYAGTRTFQYQLLKNFV